MTHPALSLAHFFDPFMIGDLNQFLNLFDLDLVEPLPTLDDPIRGKIVGRDALTEFFHSFSHWMQAHQAETEVITTIYGSGDQKYRVVIESLLSLNLEGTVKKLPVALVGEHNSLTGQLTKVRIYHTTWFLFQSHRIRPPLLTKTADIRFPNAVAHYLTALAQGDLESILDAFDLEKAYVREPSGGDYVFQGLEGLTQFYTFLFSFGGGAKLEHCCVTEDGINCAIEYNILGLGNFTVPQQAGIAVYQQGDNGSLIAARIYDNFEPPSR